MSEGTGEVGLGGGGECPHGWVQRLNENGDHQVYYDGWKCMMCGMPFAPVAAVTPVAETP